jgi:hypothetical protein
MREVSVDKVVRTMVYCGERMEMDHEGLVRQSWYAVAVLYAGYLDP